MRGKLVFMASFLVLAACGGGSDTAPTGTNQTCNSQHECINDVCECTTSGMSGTPCTEATCEDECEVCSST